MIHYRNLAFTFSLLLISSCQKRIEIKYFDKMDLAQEYSELNHRKLLLLFTGFTLSTRTFEELLFEDIEVVKALKENEIDVLVLNYDDKVINNQIFYNEIFKAKKWPVCGVIDSKTKLISKLCYLGIDKQKTKEELLKLILGYK